MNSDPGLSRSAARVFLSGRGFTSMAFQRASSSGDLGCRHGLGIEIALGMVAAQFPQAARLTVRLDALRRDLKLQASSQADDGGDDRLVVGILLQVPHEAAVDLDMIDRELLQMGQRGVAGAEIVESDLDAMLPELRESATIRCRSFGREERFP